MSFFKKLVRILPLYGWVPLIFEFLWNTAVYGGAKLIAGGWHHYNMETSFDQRIPFWPWTITIYFICFLFWVINYVLIVQLDREHAYRFLSADFLAKCICLVFFLLVPTTNTRPEITGTGIFDYLMRFLYWVDSADNLFPSIHCLVSWFCFIGIRGRKEIPAWYRFFSCVMAIAVFLSTLTTKQHVIADVIAGWLLAEICFYITGHTRFARVYGSVFEKITKRVFGRLSL